MLTKIYTDSVESVIGNSFDLLRIDALILAITPTSANSEESNNAKEIYCQAFFIFSKRNSASQAESRRINRQCPEAVVLPVPVDQYQGENVCRI